MKINPKNIRFRLIAWYVFSLGCVHLILAILLYRSVSANFQQELDARLRTYADCIIEMLPKHDPRIVPEVVAEMRELHGVGEDLYVRVVDDRQRLIYESTDLPTELLASLQAVTGPPLDQPTTLSLGKAGPWRMVMRTAHEEGHGTYIGQVAVPLRAADEALAWLRTILIVILPCVMVLASLGAWLLLNRALAPLHEVVRISQFIEREDFSQRLSVPKTGDEVQVLAEAYNQMSERLQRSFTQMRQFISDASHELRTPLAVLKGEVELGLKDHACTNNCQEILGMCASEIGRMSRLVDRLLFLSSADAEKIVLERKPVALANVMAEMLDEARILAETKNIQVELRNDCHAVIRADEMRLRQLLLNLVDNAVKYTPPGGQITLGSCTHNGQVELFVTDTGIGIELQDLPRIFDRFYRADSSRSGAEGGSGLGLAISKWIVEAHGGAIHVQSTPGQGSTFTVRVPLTDAAGIEIVRQA